MRVCVCVCWSSQLWQLGGLNISFGRRQSGRKTSRLLGVYMVRGEKVWSLKPAQPPLPLHRVTCCASRMGTPAIWDSGRVTMSCLWAWEQGAEEVQTHRAHLLWDRMVQRLENRACSQLAAGSNIRWGAAKVPLQDSLHLRRYFICEQSVNTQLCK